MPGVLAWLRFKAMLAAGIVLVPWFWLHLRASRPRREPADYFLHRLATTPNGFLQAIFQFVVLSMATRNRVATWANRARHESTRRLQVWALTPRHARLLLEAALWHESGDGFAAVSQLLRDGASDPAGTEALTAEYVPIARGEPYATDAMLDRLVLPVLHRERRAAWLKAGDFIVQAAEAMRESLRHVPDVDPRRG